VDVETANTGFTALTLAANAAFVVLLGVGLFALGVAGVRGRAIGRRTGTLVGPWALPVAAVVAVVATFGSLYYSEIEGFVPCDLCWFQRICMYPLSAILVVAVLRSDRGALWYAAPFVVLGAPVALYHWLVERVPSIADTSSCSVFVPCSAPYFEKLGFVTLAFMDLSAFLLIGALLVVTALTGGTRPPRGTLEGA
jgi:disulfide bond formation protein DsbB